MNAKKSRGKQRQRDQRGKAPRRKKSIHRPLHFQSLEERLVLATVNWIGGSGDWNTVANWSDGATNRLPGAADDAVINVAGITVTHAAGVHAVQSLTINDPFTLAGGALTVSGNLLAQNG